MYRFICGVRATRAARLLVESGMSVGEISAALGFPDEKNFARFFCREKGLTPSVYRARYRG